MSLLSRVLLPQVTYSEQFGKLSGVLFPEEEEALGFKAVQQRRDSFAAGRTCARQALQNAGLPEARILRGAQGEPLWPEGIVGSITHCEEYCAAATAHTLDFISIGIDAEINEPLSFGVLKLIALQDELEWLRRSPKSPICWDKLLFSIKESIYKAWYPVLHCWLGFEQVLVTIEPNTGSFVGTVLPHACENIPPNMLVFRGRYIMMRSLIATAVCIPRTCVGSSAHPKVFSTGHPC